jgi:hypothetical protein
VRAFGQELFAYITTLVPYWRVCDEAWALDEGDDHLTGIGVLRNYGGQVLIVPWDDSACGQLAHVHKRLKTFFDRIMVVVDDRKSEDLEAIRAICSPIVVLPWSRRAELAAFVVKDTVD